MTDMTTLTDFNLNMLKVVDDIHDKNLFVSTDGVLRYRGINRINSTITRNLINVEHNKDDNCLYFMFDNGDVISVKLPSPSSFGRGPRGKQGDRGDNGRDGLPGKDGDDGDKGCPGLIGSQGKKGIKGEKGDKGVKGRKGEKGDRGPIGITGLQGYRGYPNDDPDDPLATVIDPKSVGPVGDDGLAGKNIEHFSFCRESEPPRDNGPNTVWGKIYSPVYSDPEKILLELPCTTVVPTACPTLPAVCSTTIVAPTFVSKTTELVTTTTRAARTTTGCNPTQTTVTTVDTGTTTVTTPSSGQPPCRNTNGGRIGSSHTFLSQGQDASFNRTAIEWFTWDLSAAKKGDVLYMTVNNFWRISPYGCNHLNYIWRGGNGPIATQASMGACTPAGFFIARLQGDPCVPMCIEIGVFSTVDKAQDIPSKGTPLLTATIDVYATPPNGWVSTGGQLYFVNGAGVGKGSSSNPWNTDICGAV